MFGVHWSIIPLAQECGGGSRFIEVLSLLLRDVWVFEVYWSIIPIAQNGRRDVSAEAFMAFVICNCI